MCSNAKDGLFFSLLIKKKKRAKKKKETKSRVSLKLLKISTSKAPPSVSSFRKQETCLCSQGVLRWRQERLSSSSSLFFLFSFYLNPHFKMK